jgi:nucleoside-triphosphatase THEP1
MSDVVSVGSYIFDATAFERGNEILKDDLSKESLVFVDEIGKLELRGAGFDAAFRTSQIGGDKNASEGAIWVIVVRDTLLEDVKKAYGLQQAGMLTRNDFDLKNLYFA